MTAWVTHGVSAPSRAEACGHRSQEKLNRGCSGHFICSPGGGRGFPKEGDRDSTGQNASKRRRGAGRGRGGVEQQE